MDPCDAALGTWRRFQLLVGRLGQTIDRTLYRETGLSDADASVVLALLDAPASGMHSLELRHELGWEKSRLSHQLSRMERRGLLERSACPDDARSSLVRLTPMGQTLGLRARAILRTTIEHALRDALTPEQISQLDAITAAVSAHLDVTPTQTDRRSAASDRGARSLG